MTELEKALLKKVEELSKENERLQETIDKLHADVFFYENHWREHHHIYPRCVINPCNNEADETEECPFI